MSPRCAPMALRMPISRVRSVTVTNMMFMTPMPPTSSEIAATAPSSSVNVPVAAVTAARIELGLKIEKSGSFGRDVVAVRRGSSVTSDVRRVDRVRARRLHRDAGEVAVAGEGVLHGGQRGDHPVVLVLRARCCPSR